MGRGGYRAKRAFAESDFVLRSEMLIQDLEIGNSFASHTPSLTLPLKVAGTRHQIPRYARFRSAFSSSSPAWPESVTAAFSIT